MPLDLPRERCPPTCRRRGGRSLGDCGGGAWARAAACRASAERSTFFATSPSTSKNSLPQVERGARLAPRPRSPAGFARFPNSPANSSWQASRRSQPPQPSLPIRSMQPAIMLLVPRIMGVSVVVS